MGSYRQTFLYNFSTLVTFLTGEAWVHSNHLMTSSCSLLFKNSEELTPCGVQDGFRQMVVLDHIGDLKVFYGKMVIAFSVLLCHLEMVIAALTLNLQMRLCCTLSRLPASMRAFLATTHGTLLTSQRTLRRAIEAWVRNGVPLAISQERFEPYINTDVRMLTDTWRMLRSEEHTSE